MKQFIPKITFWRVVATIIVVAGLYSTYLRFTGGLGASTNLSDDFPWGLWIGFDILVGVGLAAGGFTICAITHIFNIEKYKPLTRPAILTAFLGYLLVIFGLMYDLGKPYNIWHAIIYWNPRSVMFEVAWCVMLYTTVLFLEFLPIALEKFRLKKLLSFMKKTGILIMITGVILSTLHQSSLGSLFLIVPQKMYPLWYSGLLPLYFFISAVGAGLTMVIFEAYLSARAFNKGIEADLLSRIGLYSVIVLMLGLIIRLIDFFLTDKIHLLFTINNYTLLFYLEILVGTLVPFGLLIQKRIRENRRWLYASSIMVISGFLLNRLNVSITSITPATGVNYFPSINEISVTLMLVTLGMWAFKIIARNFPVFASEVHYENHQFNYDQKLSESNL
ncbi:NrfD/PsrC family molybdoenzyme membrane anchor subunit [Ignavibacterium album]|uniref:NrfD/PsrC family molybdoenzyme membrane anchor subunit n=1 Tax=Ignavibacterium album TaxID=591197 RepID=UPI0026EE25BC|nr:Ni/Fe-hydrogenase cytochrome b subunit [Ignavibacterium album]